MDKTSARKMAAALRGKECGGWRIGKLINSGKSAIVLEARKRRRIGAIKIFDPELVEKHGAEVQAQRITREKSLIGQSHPHLVEILDGGFWKGKGLFFVVMEYLPWPNLADVLKDVPAGRERRIISQIASAAHFLDGLKICHRDIKPENVAISPDFRESKLLDLGVIKPHEDSSIPYGPDGGPFLGTLRYSPPEFLLGKVEDAPTAWRSVTFYQLGGVLHDLIMRRPLFAEYQHPYARLVLAVTETRPEIESASVSPALVELARDCLLKSPTTRFELVSWRRFEREPRKSDAVAVFQSKISRRLVAAGDQSPSLKPPSTEDATERLNEYADGIRSLCKLECIEKRAIFPPIEVHVTSDTDAKRVVLLYFEPSASHLLKHHWRFEVQVQWTDAPSDVIDVTAGSSISSARILPNHSLSEAAVLCFKGPYTPEAVRRAILPYLYSAMDKAQQAGDAVNDGQVHALIPESKK